MLDLNATHQARGPVAIVTESVADYAMLRTYSTLRAHADVTVEVFRDPADAEWYAGGRGVGQIVESPNKAGVTGPSPSVEARCRQRRTKRCLRDGSAAL